MSDHGCPFLNHECFEYCRKHVHNNAGQNACGGGCGGILWQLCECYYCKWALFSEAPNNFQQSGDFKIINM